MNIETKPGVVAATRIAAGDDRTRYDNFAIAFHWLTVLLVLVQFGLAEFWGFAPRPTRQLMIVTHMSFGVLLTLVLILRVSWRLVPGHRVRTADSGWIELASKTVHYLLYGLLASEVVLGFLMRWSGKQAINFFGLAIPSPFAPFSKLAHRLVAGTHNWTAWIIIILAAGHALAALFHHFVLRDDVLRRMLPGRHTKREDARVPSPGLAAGEKRQRRRPAPQLALLSRGPVGERRGRASPCARSSGAPRFSEPDSRSGRRGISRSSGSGTQASAQGLLPARLWKE